jgi:hypothetical protein
VGDHLIATRVKNKPQEPNKIDVRINQATGLATHIEMSWPENAQPPRRMDGEGAMNGDGPRGPGAMNGEGRPPRRMDGEGAMNGDGPRNGGPSKGSKPSVPMGPPSKMTLIVEPPITFDAAWFTPEKQLSINGK